MPNDRRPLRWHLRFQSFERAHALLSEAIALRASRELSVLELEGVVQRFE